MLVYNAVRKFYEGGPRSVEGHGLALAPLPGTRPHGAALTLRARGYEASKRVLDVLLATVLLLVMAPVLLIAAIAVKLDSPGPVLFRQVRCGRHGRPFKVLKLRTMSHGASPEAHRKYIAVLATQPAEASTGLKKLTGDARITRVGALLRKTSLDELPQLLNVLTGGMSLVGPRPAIEYELHHYAPAHFARFEVRPGLTGLWQVSGRNRLGFDEMLHLDCEYARSASLRTDASILLRTPLAVLRYRGC
jgi:lipopolysaccharide/colanic/teichoic acid biosynthesis glycosyltransferase